MKNFAIGLLLCAGIASATPSVFLDQFPGNSCTTDAVCDVIGAISEFDLAGVSIDLQAGEFKLWTNWYDAKVDTANDVFMPYRLGSNYIAAADLQFKSGGQMYAIALSDHSDGLFHLGTTVKGGLYETTGSYTSDQFWASAGAQSYREGKPVWMNSTGATLQESPTSFDISRAGPAEFQVTVRLDTNNAAYQAFKSHLEQNGYTFTWASADCANDFTTGSMGPVPEPATYAMMGAGLIGLALVRRKRARG